MGGRRSSWGRLIRETLPQKGRGCLAGTLSQRSGHRSSVTPVSQDLYSFVVPLTLRSFGL